MNFSPDQIRMASEMMKNMKPEDMQNMMRTFQQNPEMMEQARRMMGGGGGFPPSPPTGFPSQPSFTPQTSPLDPIAALKNSGNELIKLKDYEKAGIKYLEAILDIETLRAKLTPSQTSDAKFLAALNDLEIACRNNYCIAKTNLEDYSLVLPHCDRILLMDPRNVKALFNSSQAYFHLREYENARSVMEKLIQVMGGGSADEKITGLKKKIDDQLKLKSEKVAESPAKPSEKNVKFSDPEFAGEPQETPKKEQEKQDPKPEPKTEQKSEPKPEPKIEPEPEPKIEPKVDPKPEPKPEPKIEPKTHFEEPKIAKPAPTTEKEKIKAEFDDFKIENDSEDTKTFTDDLEREFEEAKKKRTLEPTDSARTDRAQPTPKDTAAPQTSPQEPPTSKSFFDKYWQVLLGILIGMLLSRVLRG